MRELSSVTLCCVDTRTPMLALMAMERSMRTLRFGDAILFAAPQPEIVRRAGALGVRVLDPGKLDSIEAYSRFMLQGLLAHARHDFMLVVQWDGFVVNPESWSDEFLRYDYIGAVWPEEKNRYRVGNGGFSLRSRRLLQALRAPEIQVTHPEDVSICEVNRSVLEQQHDIRFAPAEVAERFSYEHIKSGHATFGFHGVFNLIDVLSSPEMLELVQSMHHDMVFSAGMRTLAKRLIADGQYDAAQYILLGRIRQGDRRWRVLSLYGRLLLRKLLAGKA